jgi:hypothetical protein
VRVGRWGAVVFLAGTLGVAGLIAQQAQPSVDGSMTALVAEIRLLRQAVEQSGATAAQAQLLLGRVSLQEQRLANLGRVLQDARSRYRDAQTDAARHEEELRRMSTGPGPSEPHEREAWTQQVAQMKREAARAAARVAELRADDAEAERALTSEQGRWSDFNQRLEALERGLASQASSGR